MPPFAAGAGAGPRRPRSAVGGERDVRHRQRRRLDQDACRLGALRAGQRDRSRPDLRDEHPLELPHAVAEP